jgi:hypothetical protein
VALFGRQTYKEGLCIKSSIIFPLYPWSLKLKMLFFVCFNIEASTEALVLVLCHLNDVPNPFAFSAF